MSSVSLPVAADRITRTTRIKVVNALMKVSLEILDRYVDEMYSAGIMSPEEAVVAVIGCHQTGVNEAFSIMAEKWSSRLQKGGEE